MAYDESTTDTVCVMCGRVCACGTMVASFSDQERTGGRGGASEGTFIGASDAGGKPVRAAARLRSTSVSSAASAASAAPPARSGDVRGSAGRRAAQLARDSRWIREASHRCGLHPRVAETATEVARALADRPFWVHKKNNNLMGVRVACLFHAAVIEEAPREYKALADAAGVPRRSVKNMIAATQAGHDEVARRVYRGCRHRSWPARVCVESMVPGFLSELPWMSDRTSRMTISACKKTSEGFGGCIDNHCPRTRLAGTVATAILSTKGLAEAAVAELVAHALAQTSEGQQQQQQRASSCHECGEAAAGFCEEHGKALEAEVADRAGIAIATMRQVCEKARQAGKSCGPE